MNRLKELRKGKYTQSEMADLLRVARPTYTKYESGAIAMSEEVLTRLSEIFHVSIDYILGRAKIPERAIPRMTEKRICVIGVVRCGPGGLAYEERDGFEYADVDDPDEYFYLRTEGDSMEPDIHAGELALVRIQDDVENGELAVVIVDGEEGMLKKVIKQNNSIVLQSFNRNYPPRVFVGEECNLVHIAGKVVKTVRSW